MSTNKKIKRLLAGSLVLTTMAAGTAFALSDARGELSKWYDVAFQQAKEGISQTLKEDLSQTGDQLRANQSGLIDRANKGIKDTYNLTLLHSIGGIHVYQGEYLKQISQTNAAIKSAAPGDFAQYISETNKKVNADIEQKARVFIEELDMELDKEVDSFKNELDIKAQDAPLELSGVITSAKDSILRNIESGQKNAEEKVSQNIDEQTERTRQEIKKNINETSSGVLNGLNEQAKNIENQASQEIEIVLIEECR